MEYIKEALAELNKKVGSLSQKKALLGFDGFVDTIVRPVDQRQGPGTQFQPVPTMKAFGDKVQSAVGKSTNIELHVDQQKIGGNGPILANALLKFDIKVQYIGALGQPNIHPVFQEFSQHTDAISICEPAYTDALEFQDGKIMLSKMASLDTISYQRLIEVVGEGKLLDHFSRADLIALVNWTMTPHMTAILNQIVDTVMPAIGPRETRTFFFDLADPAKRSREDLSSVLNVIKRFQAHGSVTLGLNFNEALQVYSVLFNKECTADTNKEMAIQTARKIRQALDITHIVVHPYKGAACADRHETIYVEGPYTENPKLSTGAGDSFNAGFLLGYFLGLEPKYCLNLAVGASGFYVREARPSTLTDLTEFLSQWQ